ncbi:unnamed protein product, partial [Brenthis ino]
MEAGIMVETLPILGSCILCLKEGVVNSMLIKHENKKESYTDMLFKCFCIDIAILELDDTKCLICHSCIQQLESSLKFREQAETSLKALEVTIRLKQTDEAYESVKIETTSTEVAFNQVLNDVGEDLTSVISYTKDFQDENSDGDILRNVKLEDDIDFDDTEADESSESVKIETTSTEVAFNQALNGVGEDLAVIGYSKDIQNQESGSDTDSEHESGAPGPSTKKKSRTEILHKECVTTYSKQNFKPGETQSTDNESRRGSSLQIIGDIVIKQDDKQMEVYDENPAIDHVEKQRQIIGVRLNRAPKTSAERGREFRARRALLKQQIKQQQELDAIVEIATEYFRSDGPSEDNQVHGPSEIRIIEKRARSAEATRRWREKKNALVNHKKKQAKTAAQRMREYRQRKKM